MSSLSYTADHTFWQQRISHEARPFRRSIPVSNDSKAVSEVYLPPSNPNLLRDIPFHNTTSRHAIVSTWHAKPNWTGTAHTGRRKPRKDDPAALPQALQTWDGSSVTQLASQAPLGLLRSRTYLESSIRRSLEADLRKSPVATTPSTPKVNYNLLALRDLLATERTVTSRQRMKQLQLTIDSLTTRRQKKR